MSLSSLTKSWVQYGLYFYKQWISPMLPGACRFVPTCSEYAAEAIEHHGVLRGSALALWRLLRCQPLARGGFDPVPHANKVSRCCSHNMHSVCEPRLKTGNWQPGTGN